MPKTEEGKFARVFERLDDIRDRLTRLEAISAMSQKSIDDHDERLRTLEVAVNRGAGGVAVAGGVLGAIGGLVVAIISIVWGK